jgi:alpha-galactosidase/6-phospho-beta-glucosidase family protein
MKIIEVCYTFLFYYKEAHIQGNEDLYKKLLEEIDMNHKKAKAEKYKKEEEKRALELYKKLQAKKDRIVFKPKHQDIY